MKILAIDDIPDNLTALKTVVEDRLPGIEVLTALNGAQGIAIARAENPDIILLDIVMPGMDGYAVCRKLKEDKTLQIIPVLFLTALKTDRNSRVKALEAGADGFLSKPFDELELTAQIRAMTKIKAAAIARLDDAQHLANLVAERTRALQQSQNSMLNLLEDLRTENLARIKSEELQRQREIVLRGILETTADAILAVDTHGKVIQANQRFVAMWSIPKELLDLRDDQKLLDYVLDQLVDPASFLNKVYSLYQSTDNSLDIVTCKDGRIFERNSCPLLMNDCPHGRVWSFRNITAHKLAEESLSQQLDELRRWQNATLGRESRIAELKSEVNALAARLAEAPPYATPDELERQVIP